MPIIAINADYPVSDQTKINKSSINLLVKISGNKKHIKHSDNP
jgi:hypothetical protein